MDLSSLSSNWKALEKSFQKYEADNRHNSKRAKLSASKSLPRGHKQRHDTRPMSSQNRPSRTSRPSQTTYLNSTRTNGLAPSTSLQTHDKHATPSEPLKISLPGDILNAGLTPNANPLKYIALDCEMVGVGISSSHQSALARVSVVDFDGTQIYDSFVHPKEAVTDYRTAVSGITRASLSEARTFEVVQRQIAELLEGRILVGHAVKNDLKVLMLPQPKSRIRDTSRFEEYQEMCGRRPALRNLARRVLGVEIQNGKHSSVEDARVAMALFRRRKVEFETIARKRFGDAAAGQGVGKKGESNGVRNAERGDVTRQDDSDSDDDEQDNESYEDEGDGDKGNVRGHDRFASNGRVIGGRVVKRTSKKTNKKTKKKKKSRK